MNVGKTLAVMYAVEADRDGTPGPRRRGEFRRAEIPRSCLRRQEDLINHMIRYKEPSSD